MDDVARIIHDHNDIYIYIYIFKKLVEDLQLRLPHVTQVISVHLNKGALKIWKGDGEQIRRIGRYCEIGIKKGHESLRQRSPTRKQRHRE